MRLTLEDILQDVGGYVDKDVTTPTGTDLTTRINYANRSLQKWAKTYDWDELTSTYGFTASYASTVSLALPTNFKKPMSALYYYADTSTVPSQYTIIPRPDRFLINTAGEDVAYIDGNPGRGYYLIVPAGLPSGASLVMDIQTYPSALATLTDYVEISDPQYIVQDVIAQELEARSDARFPYAKEDAKTLLASMIENQHAKNKGMINRIPRSNTFVIGRD
jgi:hypothetical protein